MVVSACVNRNIPDSGRSGAAKGGWRGQKYAKTAITAVVSATTEPMIIDIRRQPVSPPVDELATLPDFGCLDVRFLFDLATIVLSPSR